MTRNNRLWVLIGVLLVVSVLCACCWMIALRLPIIGPEINDQIAVLRSSRRKPGIEKRFIQKFKEFSSLTTDTLLEERVEGAQVWKINPKCVRITGRQIHGTNKPFSQIVNDYHKIFANMPGKYEEYQDSRDSSFSLLYSEREFLFILRQETANRFPHGDQYQTVYGWELIYGDPSFDACYGA